MKVKEGSVVKKIDVRYRLVSLLSLGHLVTDMTQSIIPVLLPSLIAEHHLTYAAAAGIVFAMTVVSSLVQPLFGHFADRLSRPWFIPVGVLLAGLGIAVTGVVPSYRLILLAVAVSGLGVAAYHPEGGRLVNYVAGEKKATAMSIFGVGGQIGFAIGPLITTAILISLNLKGTLLFAFPSILMGIFLTFRISQFSTYVKAATKRSDSTQEIVQDEWGPFIRLSGVVFCRSIIFYGLNTFLPLYWINVLHQSKAAGGTALTILFTAGVVGNIIGGRLSDHFGYRSVVWGGFSVVMVLLPVFVSTNNVLVATLLLVAIGLIHYATYSPIVVMGQRYLPNHVGLASGVTFGLAVTIGGVTAPLLGLIADHHGIRTALWVVAFLPILATGLSLTLSHPKR
jgi:FSR family fosmidomycin resistance protein-like MFS transporter